MKTTTNKMNTVAPNSAQPSVGLRDKAPGKITLDPEAVASMNLEQKLTIMFNALSGERFIQGRAAFAVLARETEPYIDKESGGLRTEVQAQFACDKLVRAAENHRARMTEMKIRHEFPALFWGNLPADVLKDDIEKLCRSWTIKHVHVAPNEPGKSSAWAKVYMSEADVAAALNHFLSNPPEIRGRQVFVTRATTKSASRGKS